MPVHIDTVLLKVASRCNLDCSYCYVYHMGDNAWQSLPKRMSSETQALVIGQLTELKRSQGRPFSIVLHGGEPLLLGARRLENLFDALRASLGRDCGISVQTNGVLISDAILDVCDAHGVRISVSIDGPARLHDKFRKDLRSKPTHSDVMRGIGRLMAHVKAAELFSGVLAVVDPTSSPTEVYNFFRELDVPSVDFLYRDGNHTSLPYGKESVESDAYGRWMAEVLDLYINDPEPMRIRMLDDMIKLLLGGVGVKEGVGLTDFGILIIDTDGAIKKNDTLKSSPLRDNFIERWNVKDHSMAEIASSVEFHAYHLSQRPAAAACLACPLLRVCGGGMVTHRYKRGSDYDNPTVFCADQKYLIGRIQKYLSKYGKIGEAAA